MQRKTIDVWVGLFVLLGIAALMFLALKAGNLGSLNFGGQQISVTARFDNIGGLKPQAPIKSAGVVVGRVGAISYDDNRDQALVVMKLNAGHKFSKNSTIKILTAGLLGEQYIGISNGGKDDPILADGDKINFTSSAVVLEDLIGQFLYSKAAEGKDGSK